MQESEETAKLAKLERRAKWQDQQLSHVRGETESAQREIQRWHRKYKAARQADLAAKSMAKLRLQQHQANDTAQADVAPEIEPSRVVRTLGRLERRARQRQTVPDSEPVLEHEEQELTGHERARLLVASSGMFDEDYYLLVNEDVRRAGVDALDHYILHGGVEGRAPSELFDSAWYLQNYRDVYEAEANPLLHYIEHGEEEGRLIQEVGELRGNDHPRLATGPVPPAPETFEEVCGSFSFAEYDDDIDTPIEISVIVPIYNSIDYTISCLRSLAEVQSRYRWEVIVMDDCSTDPDVEVLKQIRGLRYLRNPENLGFLRNCNRSIDFARGRYIVFLNNDTNVDRNWLDPLRTTFEDHPNVGIVGSKLVYPDGRLQEAGGLIWEDGSGWNFGRLEEPDHPRFNYVRDVDYVSGASLMVEKANFESLGRFDEGFAPAYYEDTDLCFAVRQQGKRVVYQPASSLIHHEGISSGTDITTGVKQYQAVNKDRFVEKWQDVLSTHLPNGVEPKRACDRRPRGHILIVDESTPTPDQDSGSVDMANMMRILCEAEYRVHFLPRNLRYIEGYTERLQQMGVECVRAPFYTSIGAYLEEWGDFFDQIILSRVDAASAAIDLVLERCPSAKVIFYTVDLHFLREQRAAELKGDLRLGGEAQDREEVELGLMEVVDTTIVLSEREKEILLDMGQTDVEVLPLIRDVPDPTTVPFGERRGVVFVGGFRHPPNLDAVEFLVQEVWPAVRKLTAERGLPSIDLNIVGSRTPEHFWNFECEDIKLYGFVENIRHLFERSVLSIAPLRYGAGLKGKVATSLGYGVPVVGTSMAFEGMPGDGLEDILLAGDSADELAKLVVDLSEDGKRWADVSQAGMSYVSEHYSLQAISDQLAKILTS